MAEKKRPTVRIIHVQPEEVPVSSKSLNAANQERFANKGHSIPEASVSEITEKKAPKVMFIQVKPAEKVSLSRENRNKVYQNEDHSKFFSDSEARTAEIEGSKLNEITRMFMAKEATYECKDTKKELLDERRIINEYDGIRPKKRKKRKIGRVNNRVLPVLDDGMLKNNINASDNPGLESTITDNEKRGEDKKPKKELVKESKMEEEELQIEETTADDTENNERKLPCLFGFISAWLARRRERRKQRKQKDIAARASPQVPDATAREGDSIAVEVVESSSGPVSYIDEECDRDVVNVDEVDIPVF